MAYVTYSRSGINFIGESAPVALVNNPPRTAEQKARAARYLDLMCEGMKFGAEGAIEYADEQMKDYGK